MLGDKGLQVETESNGGYCNGFPMGGLMICDEWILEGRGACGGRRCGHCGEGVMWRYRVACGFLEDMENWKR